MTEQPLTTRPGGAPFMNRMPQSVIDRFEAEQGQQKTAGRPDEDYGKTICIMAIPAAGSAVHGIGGEEEKHATLLYFGNRGEHLPVGEIGKRLMQEAIGYVARRTPRFGAVVTGIETLGKDEPQARVWALDSPHLHQIFQTLPEVSAEVSDMYDVATEAGVTRYPTYKPHVTIGYGEEPAEAHQIASIPFDRLSLWWGDERHDFPLQ